MGILDWRKWNVELGVKRYGELYSSALLSSKPGGSMLEIHDGNFPLV
jgi:hypothetical protein